MRHFYAKYNCVKNRINRLPVQPELPVYNLLLTPYEDKGLLIWLYCHDVLKTRATVQELKWECNCILKLRYTGLKEPPLYSSYWTNRFLKYYPKFSLYTKNPKELKRQAAEDLIVLLCQYKDYNHIIKLYKIIVGDIYNYNKTGVHLGVGKKEKVIIALKAF